jgi:hypothetical protein
LSKSCPEVGNKVLGGWVGGVKKCFLGPRQTALLSAKGKNGLLTYIYTWSYNQMPQKLPLFKNIFLS